MLVWKGTMGFSTPDCSDEQQCRRNLNKSSLKTLKKISEVFIFLSTGAHRCMFWERGGLKYLFVGNVNHHCINSHPTCLSKNTAIIFMFWGLWKKREDYGETFIFLTSAEFLIKRCSSWLADISGLSLSSFLWVPVFIINFFKLLVRNSCCYIIVAAWLKPLTALY